MNKHIEALESAMKGAPDKMASVTIGDLRAVIDELKAKKQLEFADLFPDSKNGAFDGMTIEQARNILESLGNWLKTRRIQPRFTEAEAILMTQYADELDKLRSRLA